MIYSIGSCVLSLSSSLQMLFEYYTAQGCEGNVFAFQVNNNFGIHKFALYIHMWFIFDLGVFKGELTSYQTVCVLCVLHVIKWVSSMTYCLYFFLCVMLFYFMGVMLFHFMDYRLYTKDLGK